MTIARPLQLWSITNAMIVSVTSGGRVDETVGGGTCPPLPSHQAEPESGGCVGDRMTNDSAVGEPESRSALMTNDSAVGEPESRSAVRTNDCAVGEPESRSAVECSRRATEPRCSRCSSTILPRSGGGETAPRFKAG